MTKSSEAGDDGDDDGDEVEALGTHPVINEKAMFNSKYK
jgi:hypothetical protein